MNNCICSQDGKALDCNSKIAGSSPAFDSHFQEVMDSITEERRQYLSDMDDYIERINSMRISRVYIRQCGICGIKLPQEEMIRDDCSDTGWVCASCDSDLHPEDDFEDF